MTVFNNPEICSRCVGKCCRYFMLQIDTPKSRADFENIRWYISHAGATICVEKSGWFLHIDSICKHLTADGRCGIYENRPQICREHSPSECEYEMTYEPDIHFRDLAQLDEYIQKRFSRKSKKTEVVSV